MLFRSKFDLNESHRLYFRIQDDIDIVPHQSFGKISTEP